MTEVLNKKEYSNNLTEFDENAVTPMMQQYLLTKADYKDCILFYRLGDFYEMFFDDAKIASKELELTLTGKSCGLPERAPMCGVPWHSASGFISRLVNRGYKVAVCEQLEDPKEAKGIVKRDVIRVITPGTNIDESLDGTKNNYIASVFFGEGHFGISFADVSTGEFFVSEEENSESLLDILEEADPSEIVVNEAFLMSSFDRDSYSARHQIKFSPLTSIYYDTREAERTVLKQFRAKDLSALGLSRDELCLLSSGALLNYLSETQKVELSQLSTLRRFSNGRFMVLDYQTRRNLELVETMREKKRQGSLLWVLDHTKTAMGARTLRRAIEMPLLVKEDIEKRLDAVEELKNDIATSDELREYLSGVYDLERLLTRVTYKTANPRDLIALKNSLSVIPGIKRLFSDARSALLSEISKKIDDLSDITELLESSIEPEPPAVIYDGGFIRKGYSEEADKLRSAKTEGKKWLSDIEAKEREKTDIKNLKIKYNKVFGYFLEVSNSFRDKVPDYFIRKQTLVNAERYYTPELKELENTLLGSEEKLLALEKELYFDILDRIKKETERLQSTARLISSLDLLQSLAYTADRNRYVRPSINEEGRIEIRGGRHPVIEKIRSDELFVENDTVLDNDKKRISIITGPNMAGKSTYMRQTALIVLMAHLGSFVPANSADISICDRIFTRVGASDDLSSGQSTFMVEMNEVANILKNATKDSLIILDEIGRGTSTYDGLSIAWAVVEYIADKKNIGAKTLFATHYHELTELEGLIDGVNNYCVAVRENGRDIVFLRKIVRGGADKSYGIAVARIAGLPDEVLKRAEGISIKLSDNDISKNDNKSLMKPALPSDNGQLSLFSLEKNQGYIMTENEKRSIGMLRDIKPEEITPIEAMNTLFELKKLLK